jgi:hypothetical protein
MFQMVDDKGNQRAFAAKCNIHPNTVPNLLGGKPVRRSTLEKVSAACNVPYEELLDPACGDGVTQPVVHGADQFRDLLKESFLYVLRRKKEPSPDSDNAMLFYGVAYDEAHPRLLPLAGVGAIGTELRHLGEVLGGGVRDRYKKRGEEQIADELIDMFRDLFVLAIANGLENWEDVDWFAAFSEGYREARTARPWEYARMLDELYRRLLEMARGGKLRKEQVRQWLHQQSRTMGGISKWNGVTFEHLGKDLRKRLREKRHSRTATVRHSPHDDYPREAVCVICRGMLCDRPGAYVQFLDAISRNRFDLWASESRTAVWGECAEVRVLMSTTDTYAPADVQIEKGIRAIAETKFQPEGAIRVRRNAPGADSDEFPLPLLIGFWRERRARFHAKSEGQFIRAMSGVLQKYWNTVPENREG